MSGATDETIEVLLADHLAERAGGATVRFGIDDVATAARQRSGSRASGATRWLYNAAAAIIVIGGLGAGLWALGRPSTEPTSTPAPSAGTVDTPDAGERRPVDDRIDALDANGALQRLEPVPAKDPSPWLLDPVVLDAGDLGRVQIGAPSPAMIDRWRIEPTDATSCAVTDRTVACSAVVDLVEGSPNAWAAPLGDEPSFVQLGPAQVTVVTTFGAGPTWALAVGLPPEVTLVVASRGSEQVVGQVPQAGTAVVTLRGSNPIDSLIGFHADGRAVWSWSPEPNGGAGIEPVEHDPQLFAELGYGGLIPAPADLGPGWTGFHYRSGTGFSLPARWSECPAPGATGADDPGYATVAQGLIAWYDGPTEDSHPVNVMVIREIEGGLSNAFAGFRRLLDCQDDLEARPLPDLPGARDVLAFSDGGGSGLLVLRDDLILLVTTPEGDGVVPIDVDLLTAELLAAHDGGR